MSEDIKIMIMCGGRGKRLGKITTDIPKPLIDINGKPILLHKINYYQRRGFDKIIFCIGYLGGRIIDFMSQYGEIQSEFSDAGPDSGILERISKSFHLMSQTTIVSYGDTFARIDLEDLVMFHRKKSAKLTLVVAPIENPFGVVQVDNDSNVSSFSEKPIHNHYLGYFVIERDVLNSLNEEIIAMNDGEGVIRMFNFLIEKGQLAAYFFDGLQITVNTPEDVVEAGNTLGAYYTY